MGIAIQNITNIAITEKGKELDKPDEGNIMLTFAKILS